ncbi:uncharacterized protein N7484_009802 [Penicillium longicatenatum]|uniref:uncharacterized protein n=1 Tax=Penicillium longicatenatum TaxID=1561947 RepID=UPI002547B0F7|nr:uncharacterized protein N7484_009802 [Penicillium longicatenatum]KAJ5636489.1 hypothetical protein N7484_009802 [Penicillium longicatenatum]
MVYLLSSLGIATALIAGLWFVRRSSPPPARPLPQNPLRPNPVVEKLTTALPDILVLRYDTDAFRQSIDGYWAQQEREVAQAAIIQPRNASELSKVIAFLKKEYDTRCVHKEKFDDVLFAIRGGGQSPVAGSASANGGILIDLSLFREITVAEKRQSVAIGAGCRWIDVSRILDENGLSVVGGRSSEVGVAGFTLGGGISFFTPQFGLGCSNVLAYEVVLASGEIITATASSHSDLWRALKGGSNNFCVVTRFIVRCFSSTDIWFGSLYAPSSQSPKALLAVHEGAKRADPKISGADIDLFAAGAITCFTYVQGLGIRVVTAYLAYTKLPEQPGQWPVYWKKSGFAKLWRVWSSFKVHTLTSATSELNSLSPPGKRWHFDTTTIKNDLPTIMAAHAVFENSIASLPKIKGFYYTINMQPLLPSWVEKGDPSPLGIAESTSDALIIISFSLRWDRAEDDSPVFNTTRGVIEQIDAVATEKGTSHPYRYLNYCAKWQRPMEGYGEKNLNFLRDVSKTYDPDGLFQRGCQGGFKLESRV